MWVSGDGRGQVLAKRRRRLSTVPEILAAQEQELNMKVLSLGINFFCGFPRVYNEAYARTRKCVQRSDLCFLNKINLKDCKQEHWVTG